MKNKYFTAVTLIIVCLLFSTSSYSQFSEGELTVDLDEIIRLNLQAMGGISNIEKIKDVKVVLEVDSPYLKGENTLWIDDNERFRMDAKTNGMTSSIVINGEKGWANNTNGGVDIIPPEYLNNMKSQFISQLETFKSPLYGYDPKNSKARYIGDENKDGFSYRKVSISANDDPDMNTNVFIDPATNYVRFLVRETPQGKQEIVLDSYKRVGGVLLPHVITSKFNGQLQSKLTVKSIDLAPKFDSGIFEELKPKKK